MSGLKINSVVDVDEQLCNISLKLAISSRLLLLPDVVLVRLIFSLAVRPGRALPCARARARARANLPLLPAAS